MIMDLIKKEVRYKDTRLKILTNNEEFVDIAVNELQKQRGFIENYISKDKNFLTSLKPIKIKKNSPKVVRLMAEGGKIADVGPMAAVAGTLAEFCVRKMIKKGAKIAVVENGGDIFAYTSIPIYIGIYAGYTKLSDKLALKLDPKNTPISVCSSSKLGQSLSFGNCDLASVFSKKSYVADAVATAVANKVKEESDIAPALRWAISLKDVMGVLIVKDNKVGLIGNIQKLISNKDVFLKDKVTKEPFYTL
jgi:ApbE superfamily uncharacterized protein (UPF0280 family)